MNDKVNPWITLIAQVVVASAVIKITRDLVEFYQVFDPLLEKQLLIQRKKYLKQK